MGEASFQCRNCLSIGGTATLGDSSAIGGQALKAAPLLPRCTCYVRLHKGKLPGTIAATVAALPDVPELVAVGECSNVQMPPTVVPERNYHDDAPRRPVYSVEGLPASSSIDVYRASRGDGALLGAVTVTKEHTLADVQKLLKKQFSTSANVQMFRGERHEDVRVPLHKAQMQRLAMPFFPTDDFCLVID